MLTCVTTPYLVVLGQWHMGVHGARVSDEMTCDKNYEKFQKYSLL